jgi:TRAP-type uncharacterized transport system substrate-binding protein
VTKLFSRTAIAAALIVGALPSLATAAMLKPSAATPAGIDAKLPVVPVCAGKLTGNYYKSTSLIARMNKKVVIEPKTTKGSLDNVRAVSDGTCVFGFAQADAVRLAREDDPMVETNIQRVTKLYKEYVHLLCNRKSGITKIQHLRKGHVVAVGDDGSGSDVTWKALVSANKKAYGDVKIDTRDGLDAVMAVADGDEVTCMLYVGGAGNVILKKQAQKVADKVVLVNVSDSDFAADKDAVGNSVYSNEHIGEKTYGAIQPSGTFFGKAGFSTVATDAVIVVNKAWKDAHPDLYESLLVSINTASPAIAKAAAPATE